VFVCVGVVLCLVFFFFFFFFLFWCFWGGGGGLGGVGGCEGHGEGGVGGGSGRRGLDDELWEVEVKVAKKIEGFDDTVWDGWPRPIGNSTAGVGLWAC